MAQKTLDDLKAAKDTDFFLLNKKLQTMKAQLQKQQMLGAILKERMQLNNKFIQRLTEKLMVARTGETLIEESEEVEEYNDEREYLDRELPLPLEKLAVEVNTFMHSTRAITSRSFIEDKKEINNSDEEYSLRCHSEYSDFEEENLSKSPKESKRVKEFTETTNMCEICENSFSWYVWRHRCKSCGKYLLSY